VSSAQLKHVNPLDPGVIYVVIECKITMVIEFNVVIEFIMVTEFIKFTECMLVRCDVVVYGEHQAGAGDRR